MKLLYKQIVTVYGEHCAQNRPWPRCCYVKRPGVVATRFGDPGSLSLLLLKKQPAKYYY